MKKRKNVFIDIISIKGRYKKWISKNEIFEIKKIQDDICAFSYTPTLSVVISVSDTSCSQLKRTLLSLEDQIYRNWELCVVGCHAGKGIENLLRQVSSRHKNTKIVFTDVASSLVQELNIGLSNITGEYFVCVNAGDVLAVNALYELVKILQRHPEAELIYSDEDSVSIWGIRHQPFFKPDWSPDLLLSQNYIGHLSLMKYETVKMLGGFREGYAEAEGYDLLLRLTETTKNIFHISKVLYHTKSTVPSSKTLASQNGEKVIREAMRRRNREIETIVINRQNNYGIRYKIQGCPLVSIIIPTKDKVELLKKCISSILEKTTYENYEIIVVDNRSDERQTLDYFSEIVQNRKIRVIAYNNEFNYSAINNYAVHYAQGEYIVLLNNDTEVITSAWLQGMLELCQRDDIGAVGCKLLFPNNTLQHVGVVMGLFSLAGHVYTGFPAAFPGYFGKNNCIHNLSAITAACLMTKKSIFQEVDGFDEKNLPVAFNDVDLCLKIREQGYLVLYTPYVELFHHESASRGYENVQSERARKEVEFMMKKWGEVIARDPYYNSNLTKRRADYTVDIEYII